NEVVDLEVSFNDFKKETGINVPRSLVPPAPNVDLYKPRKMKRTVKTSEEEVKKEEEDVKEAGKKKGEKKRKAEGIKI
ncbi:hypothetical protein A2U01_0054934, partial [Trifolium medium]|nr:hypothetical protein [Trifolium medium]